MNFSITQTIRSRCLNRFSAGQSKRTRRPEPVFSMALLTLAVPWLWWWGFSEHPLMIGPKTLKWLLSTLELLAIMVAMQIFVAGYCALESTRKRVMVLLGLFFLGVGALDFLHFMRNIDMVDASSLGNTQRSEFLRLAARSLAACALLVYVAMPNSPLRGRLKKRLGLGVVLLVVCLCWAMDMVWRAHGSALFNAGRGLSTMEAGLAWLVFGIHLITLLMLWQYRGGRHEHFMALCFTLGLLSISDLFEVKLGNFDKVGVRVIGHVYMVAAYLYLFQITINESLRQPLAHMKRRHQRERLALSNSPNGVLWINNSGTILETNPTMTLLTGYSERFIVGQNFNLFLPVPLRSKFADQMRDCVTNPNPGTVNILDEKLLCRDGTMLPVDIAISFCADDVDRQAIVHISNLTDRKKLETILHDQAFRDELTGLPNRSMFYLLLQQALARADRSGTRVSVLLLDLDSFKNINDSFGHAAGDALLGQVGERMRAVLRESDTLARLGGDEFAILLNDLVSVPDATQVASKLLSALSTTYQVLGVDVNLSASLGLAFFPDDGNDGDTLLRYADMAMYAAKAAGRDTYRQYSKDLEQCIHEDMQIHMRLKDAIGMGTLALYYQPQVDVVSGAIVGVEALLRWVDPVLGQVPPARFIPIAEATGLILPLSDWVLETACTQIAAWTRANRPVRVAVNFSAQQFRLPDLSKRVADTLSRTGALAKWLDIEITESLAMTHPEKASVQLNALVALGCRIALDDFGTGYSSLAYLKTLPIQELKIDKSFMDGVPDDSNDAAISRAIIALAHSLGMKLIAEGVETDAQLAFLRQNNCETYQGWLFAKAMTAADLTPMLPIECCVVPINTLSTMRLQRNESDGDHAANSRESG